MLVTDTNSVEDYYFICQDYPYTPIMPFAHVPEDRFGGNTYTGGDGFFTRTKVFTKDKRLLKKLIFTTYFLVRGCNYFTL